MTESPSATRKSMKKVSRRASKGKRHAQFA